MHNLALGGPSLSESSKHGGRGGTAGKTASSSSLSASLQTGFLPDRLKEAFFLMGFFSFLVFAFALRANMTLRDHYPSMQHHYPIMFFLKELLGQNMRGEGLRVNFFAIMFWRKKSMKWFLKTYWGNANNFGHSGSPQHLYSLPIGNAMWNPHYHSLQSQVA